MTQERYDYLEVAGEQVTLKGEFNNHVNDETKHGNISDANIISIIEGHDATINATVSRAEYAETGGSGGSGDGSTVPETHHIDDFGADPSGSTASDAALDDAAAMASEGDIIAITNGTYYFANRHTFYKSLTLDGTGARIESDCHTSEPSYAGSGSDLYQGDHYYPLFKFMGNKGSAVGVSASAGRGSDQLNVSSTASFNVGDGVIVSNEESNVAVMGRSYTPSISRIRAIQDGVLYLTKALKYDVDTSWVAAPVDFVEKPVIRNMNIYARHPLSYDADMGRVMGGPQHPFATQWTRGALIDNCYVDVFGANVYSSSDCVDAVIRDVHSGKPMNFSGSSGEAYYINGSTDITLVRPVVEECRRGVDIRSGCRTLYTIDPRISGATLGAICFHSGSTEPVQGRHEIRGGFIHCRMDDPTLDNQTGDLDRRQEYQSGTIFRGLRESSEVVVDGTELVANAEDTTVHGHIKMVNSRIVKPPEGYTSHSPLELGNGTFEFYNCEWDVSGADALQASGTTGTVKIDDATSNAPFNLSGGSHDTYWLGMIEAPSVTAGTGTVRDPYNVTV